MDLTVILSAAIFTLLAIVVATSLLSSSSSSSSSTSFSSSTSSSSSASDQPRLHNPGPGLEPQEPRLNGHVPEGKVQEEVEEEEVEEEEVDWCNISGSAHDHWDVVKSVQSEEAQPHLHPEDSAPQTDLSSTSLEVDTSSEASSGRSRRSFIGLSDKELLKCAFPHPQADGDAESPGIDDDLESDGSGLRYVPGKTRSHHLEKMLSKEELEEEQRVQREQLAAIFQLLKDNKATFGDVSEGDMEEQLRLYSI